MIIAESTTIMGVVTIITDAEIGELGNPLKSKHIKSDTKKSGSYNSRKILMAIFSFGITTRNQNNSIAAYAQWIKPGIYTGITSLQW
jgi:hypothetical protein